MAPAWLVQEFLLAGRSHEVIVCRRHEAGVQRQVKDRNCSEKDFGPEERSRDVLCDRIQLAQNLGRERVTAGLEALDSCVQR